MLALSKETQLKRYKRHKSLPDILDKVFSEYIRRRDSDGNGICRCITCGDAKPWNHGFMDCGHFISRAEKAVRYNEKNANAQCRRCNTHKNGRQFEHGLAIDKKFGKGTAEMLLNLSKVPYVKLSDLWYEETIKMYREKIKKLKK
jgi:hypothetical protein